MADEKISAMPDGSPVLDTDEIPLVHVGDTLNYSVTAAEMKTYIGAINTIVAGGLLSGGTIVAPGGTIALSALASHNLIGNAGTASAVPAAIPLGSGFVFTGGTLNTSGTATMGQGAALDATLPAGTYDCGPFIQGGTILNAYSHIVSGGTLTYTIGIGTLTGGIAAVTGLSSVAISGTADSVGTATAANVISANQHAWIVVANTSTPLGGSVFFTVKVP